MVKPNPVLRMTRTVQRDGVDSGEIDETMLDTLGFVLSQSDWSGFREIHLYFDAEDAQRGVRAHAATDPLWQEGLTLLLKTIDVADEVGIPEGRAVIRGFSIGSVARPDRVTWRHLYALRPALEELLKAITPKTEGRAS